MPKRRFEIAKAAARVKEVDRLHKVEFEYILETDDPVEFHQLMVCVKNAVKVDYRSADLQLESILAKSGWWTGYPTHDVLISNEINRLGSWITETRNRMVNDKPLNSEIRIQGQQIIRGMEVHSMNLADRLNEDLFAEYCARIDKAEAEGKTFIGRNGK